MLKKKISPTNIIFEIFPNGIRRINGKKFAVSTGISISPPPKLQVQGQFAYPPLVLGTSRVWFPKYVLRKGGGSLQTPNRSCFPDTTKMLHTHFTHGAQAYSGPFHSPRALRYREKHKAYADEKPTPSREVSEMWASKITPSN